MKLKQMKCSQSERGPATPIHSTNQFTKLSEIDGNERSCGTVNGFIPFHEVHSAFINYMKWINLAKLNGMRMNDIITVLKANIDIKHNQYKIDQK